MPRAALLVAAALMGGCTHLPPLLAPRETARVHLEFLTQATHGSPSLREALWREAETAPPEVAQLRKALLQSIPGSSRYNPASAESALEELLAGHPSAGVAAVARVRLDSLRGYAECRAETEVLKKRLSKIADIERGAHPR